MKTVVWNPPFQAFGSTLRWCENVRESGLREAGDAHKIIDLRHTGWFVDNHQDETVHGIVFQLTAKDGQARFLAGMNDPFRDGSVMVEMCIYEDKEAAARAAERLAERYAEDAREGDAEQTAQLHIEEARAEIKHLRKKIKELRKEMRVHDASPCNTAICRALHEKLSDWMAERRKQFEIIAARRENFWSATVRA